MLKLLLIKKDLIIEIISILLIVLFVYAATNKLLDIEKFQGQIGSSNSAILMRIAPFVAWFIPLIEIIASILLMISRFKLFGFYISFCLMIMFTTYIIVILLFSSHVPCSCGGIIEKMGWIEHLIFNIGFVLASLVGIILLSNKKEGGLEQAAASAT